MKHRKRTKQRERYAINVTEAQSRSYSSSSSPPRSSSSFIPLVLYYFCYVCFFSSSLYLLLLCSVSLVRRVCVSVYGNGNNQAANQSAVDSTTDFNVSLSYKIVEHKMFEKYIFLLPNKTKVRRTGEREMEMAFGLSFACIALGPIQHKNVVWIHPSRSYPVHRKVFGSLGFLLLSLLLLLLCLCRIQCNTLYGFFLLFRKLRKCFLPTALFTQQRWQQRHIQAHRPFRYMYYKH